MTRYAGCAIARTVTTDETTTLTCKCGHEASGPTWTAAYDIQWRHASRNNGHPMGTRWAPDGE